MCVCVTSCIPNSSSFIFFGSTFQSVLVLYQQFEAWGEFRIPAQSFRYPETSQYTANKLDYLIFLIYYFGLTF